MRVDAQAGRDTPVRITSVPFFCLWQELLEQVDGIERDVAASGEEFRKCLIRVHRAVGMHFAAEVVERKPHLVE